MAKKLKRVRVDPKTLGYLDRVYVKDRHLGFAWHGRVWEAVVEEVWLSEYRNTDGMGGRDSEAYAKIYVEEKSKFFNVPLRLLWEDPHEVDE